MLLPGLLILGLPELWSRLNVMFTSLRNAFIPSLIGIISDELMIFLGQSGVQGIARGPMPMREGMNTFLKEVNITFRRDHNSGRPRINKPGSSMHREQVSTGEYYYS